MVRLRLSFCLILSHFSLRFNPTMVRLRPRRAASSAVATRFQSHYGAIATTDDSEDALLARLCFNPTMVRLRLIQWVAEKEEDERFNPTMVRLRLR